MSRVRLTKSQMALIQESMKKKKTVKLTQKQYDLIKENVDMQSKPIDKPNVLQFGQFITEAINNFFAESTGELNIPESIQAMGIKPSELKYKLLKDKVINVVEGEEKDSYQFNPKGFGEWCSKYYNELVANEKSEKELTEDYDSPYEEDRPKPNHGQIYKGGEAYDDGDHTDYPEEDREEDYEYERNDSVRIVSGDTGIEEIIVINYEGRIVLFAHENMGRFRHMDIAQVAYNIIEGYVSNDGMNVAPNNTDGKAFAEGNAMFLMVNPRRVKQVLNAVDYGFGEVGNIQQILHGVFNGDEEILEVTTTGSVGGSYETPKAWSKDPKNPRMGKETMIKGGKFVKPETIDSFDTIRESVKKKTLIFENLVFKKDTPNDRIVLISDSPTDPERKKETMAVRKLVISKGFKWDQTVGGYVAPMSKFQEAKELKDILYKCKQVFDILEDLEDYLGTVADIPQEVVDAAKKDGVILSRKDEVEEYIKNFYIELQQDLDSNSYIKFATEYLEFTRKYKDKFNKNYSPRNMMLIFLQKPNSKVVGTSKDWKSVGRMQKKGSKGIMLYSPKPKSYVKDKALVGTEKDNESNYISWMDYGSFWVFDITDTFALDGSEDPTELEVDWQPSNDPNERAQELAEALKEVVSEDGIKLTFDDSRGGEGGFSAGQWINISKGSQGERLFSDLVHEFAHELIHQKTGKYFRKDEKLSSDIKEIHAEGVAVALMNYFNFDITPNKVYLEGWSKMGAKISEHIGIMTDVASYILGRLEEKINKPQEVGQD